MLSTDDPLVEGAEQTPKPRARQRQPKRCSEPFTIVPLSWLGDDRFFHAKGRLWHAMWNATREGDHPVKLSAEIWQRANVSRAMKKRLVREFEAIGAIKVDQNGHGAPVITMRVKLAKQ